MSNVPIDNDLIEQYLLGKLTDAEIRSFEGRLGVDREFARKFRLLKTFPEMMSNQGRLEYEKNRAETAMTVIKRKPFRFLKPRYLVWAISCIVFIGIALLFIFMRQNQQTENVVPKENGIRKADIVKPEVVPVKDSQIVSQPQNQQQENKEIRTVTDGAVQKAIELLNPAEGMKFSRKEMILFNWKQTSDTFTRFYIISELNDKVVFWRGIRPGIREFKVPGSSLYPGKYYWFIGTKEQKRSFIISE